MTRADVRLRPNAQDAFFWAREVDAHLPYLPRMEWHTVSLCVRGNDWLSRPARESDAAGLSLLIVPAGQACPFVSDRACTVWSLGLAPALLHRALKTQSGFRSSFQMPRLRAAAELDDDVLRSLLLALRHTVVGATGLTASFSDGIARAASAHLVAYYCDVTIDRRTQLGDGDFARLNDFITSRFTEGCTLESAACALGVSATRMTRLLKARTNQTFHQYVLQLRLECAFELLRNGQMNVTQAAMETCFGNLAHFSRTFSKHFGMPPSALKF